MSEYFKHLRFFIKTICKVSVNDTNFANCLNSLLCSLMKCDLLTSCRYHIMSMC